MNVNLEYYRIFYYVAKYQNFTRAARAMGNSQPNITRAMNLLEQEIHCTLFIRTNRGVRLTPEGEKLYIRVSADGIEYLSSGKTADFPYGISRHSSEDLQSFHATGGAGSKKW